MNLVCSECGRPAADDAMFCVSCEGLLAFETFAVTPGADLDRDRIAARRNSNDARNRSGVWRYRELLPPIPFDAIVTLREGDVPLYDAPRSAAYAGMAHLACLHLGMNPTASFKDAGMTVAISRAASTGARVAICASTGNTSASLAAYAARAGMHAVVLVPATGISASKVAQTLDYGATVVAIDGDFDAALVTVRALDPRRVAIVNSVNPYRIEGQKSAAFVLLEQRNWRVPDWIVLPLPLAGVKVMLAPGSSVACSRVIGVWVTPGPACPSTSPAITRTRVPPSGELSSATWPALMSW